MLLLLFGSPLNAEFNGALAHCNGRSLRNRQRLAGISMAMVARFRWQLKRSIALNRSWPHSFNP